VQGLSYQPLNNVLVLSRHFSFKL